MDLVTRFKASAAVTPEFLAAWAHLIADSRSTDAAQKYLEDPLFSAETLRSYEPVTLYRIRRLAGGTVEPMLSEVVDQLVADANRTGLLELADVMDEEGRLEELWSILRTRPDEIVQEVMLRRGRVARFSGRPTVGQRR